MYTNQQKLYAIKLKRLHDLYVVKSNIHLTYKYKNQNKAIHNAQSLQDKIINSIINDAIYGNSDKVRNIDSTIRELMTTTLENERKRIHRKNDTYVDSAVKQNADKYSQILSNRINTEAIKLQGKIESEIRSGIHNNLTEHETHKALKEKYGNTAKARIKNIIRDGIHSNESNISWINALTEGYNYKVWMNGRGKGKVRAWHRAKFIAPVPIDEHFDLHGSYPAQAMYPGDLNAGAENVANCRCWLRYTNRRPEGLGEKKTVFDIPQTSYLNHSNNKSKNLFTERLHLKPIETIKTTISNNTKKATSKIKNIGDGLIGRFRKPKVQSKKHDPIKKNQKKKSGLKGLNSSKKKSSKKSVEKDKWITITRLRKKIKSFTNNHIKNEIIRLYQRLVKSIKNPTIEYGFAILKDGTIIKLEQKSAKLVDIPEDLKEELLEDGIFMIGHSHPKGESPLGSSDDLCTYTKYRVSIGFSVNENGMFIVKNKKVNVNKTRFSQIKTTGDEILHEMIGEFNQYQFKDDVEADNCLKNNETKYKQLFHNFVIRNHNKYIKLYQRKLKKYGITIKFIK